MAQVGVRAVQHAEVGKIFDCHAFEGSRAALPDVAECAAGGAVDFDWVHEVDGLEACCADEEVEVVASSVFGLNACLGDFRDLAGFYVDMILCQTWIVAVVFVSAVTFLA